MCHLDGFASISLCFSPNCKATNLGEGAVWARVGQPIVCSPRRVVVQLTNKLPLRSLVKEASFVPLVWVSWPTKYKVSIRWLILPDYLARMSILKDDDQLLFPGRLWNRGASSVRRRRPFRLLGHGLLLLLLLMLLLHHRETRQEIQVRIKPMYHLESNLIVNYSAAIKQIQQS